jgi:hypothetical protein
MCYPEIQDTEIYVFILSKRIIEVLDKTVKQKGNWNHSPHSCLIIHFSVSIYLNALLQYTAQFCMYTIIIH